MYDPVTISKYFPSWKIDMGVKGVPADWKMSCFGEVIMPLFTINYLRAVKGQHHVMIVFDFWSQDVAESLVGMMIDCDRPGEG
jgi:hypothetical protein